MMMKVPIIMGMKGWAKCILDTLRVNFQTFCSQTKFRIVCLSAAKTGAGRTTALLLRDQYTQEDNNIPATATHHSKQPQVLQIQMDFGVLIVT